MFSSLLSAIAKHSTMTGAWLLASTVAYFTDWCYAQGACVVIGVGINVGWASTRVYAKHQHGLNLLSIALDNKELRRPSQLIMDVATHVCPMLMHCIYWWPCVKMHQDSICLAWIIVHSWAMVQSSGRSLCYNANELYFRRIIPSDVWNVSYIAFDVTVLSFYLLWL